jgi:chromate transporter
VVGVIVNLALFFALHVLWPHGWGGLPDLPSLAIGIAAAIALIRYRQGVVRVVLCAGAVGLLLALAARP